MPFWSGATLRDRLNELIDLPDSDSIDCAAYALKVGAEYYVTPNDRIADPASLPLQKLDPDDTFAIPPGQFAYVMTEESVSVPVNALAFISIRARVKWKGLVNVSGFHVDPGYSGRLLFAVYNAGPVKILLRRGTRTFLIWFADLDNAATSEDSKTGMSPVTNIDLDAVNHVAGEIYSIQGLSDKLRSAEKELGTRITTLERANGVIYIIATAIVTIAVFLAGQWLLRQLWPPVAPVTTVVTPASNAEQTLPTPSPTAIPKEVIPVDKLKRMQSPHS